MEQNKEPVTNVDSPALGALASCRRAVPVGRPYFVTDLVSGYCLPDWCQRAMLSTDTTTRVGAPILGGGTGRSCFVARWVRESTDLKNLAL